MIKQLNISFKIRLILLIVVLLIASWTMVQAMSRAPQQPKTELQPAIDFTLRDLTGKSHTLSAYKGKIVFLNFWASWCPPCRSEMPDMQQLYLDSDKDNFIMLAVNIGEGEKTVKQFAKKNAYTFPILLDSEGKVAGKYRIRAIPTTYIISRQGEILTRISGARPWSWDEFKKLL